MLLRVVGPSAAEVALELAGDRLAGRLRRLGQVLGLLERADVLRDLGVLRRQLVDAALPGAGVLGQVTERDGDVEQVLDVAEQGQRRLGARRLRDVVRHRRPDRQRGYPGPAARVLDDPDDAGRAFVARRLQVQAAGDALVRRGAAHRHRPGVRRVGQQRAERHDHLHAELVAALEQLGRERLPPHVRLDAADQDHVAADVGQPRERDPRRRPGDEPPAVVVEGDHRPVDLEVVVVLGLERRPAGSSATAPRGARPRRSRRPRRRSSPRRPRSGWGPPAREIPRARSPAASGPDLSVSVLACSRRSVSHHAACHSGAACVGLVDSPRDVQHS